MPRENPAEGILAVGVEGGGRWGESRRFAQLANLRFIDNFSNQFLASMFQMVNILTCNTSWLRGESTLFCFFDRLTSRLSGESEQPRWTLPPSIRRATRPDL